VTVLNPTDERGLGPEYDSPAKFLMFLPLVAQNEAGELVGRLARAWEHSPDYRTWTIHLRTDVRWHDGVPVTAHDIEFSIQLLSRPDIGYIAPNTVAISVLDDSTFTYTSAVETPLSTYRTYYPRHLLKNLDPTEFYQWPFWTQPVGNGPYRYVRHVPKTMMELEANQDYPLGTPRVEHVILKFGQSTLLELLSGNVDALIDVNPMELLKLSDDARFRRYDQRTPNVRTIYWNHRHRFFRNSKVRKALTVAINRRELLDVMNLPPDQPLFDVIFSDRQWNELPPPEPYDPARARRLLGESGWRDTDGDGIRERNGEPFRFTVLVGPAEQREAVYVQGQLRQVGVQIDIATRSEWVQVFRQVRAGEFEAAIGRFLMVLPGVMGQHQFFGDKSYIGYANPRVHELLDRAAETQSPQTQDTIYRALMEIFQTDLPVTFLHPIPSTHVAHRRLAGLSSPYRADPVWYMEELWIDDTR
jgi:peptide/nickel transport system substrate-binding protein